MPKGNGELPAGAVFDQEDPILWAVEQLDGKVWKASRGSVHASRTDARRNQKWAKQNFPGLKFRVRAYVRRETSE